MTIFFIGEIGQWSVSIDLKNSSIFSTDNISVLKHTMDFKDLIAYQKSFNLAMEVFELTKSFPIEEKYALTDQIRRSSRSDCANVAEAYRKRYYLKHFKSKLTDSDAENSETKVWLDFSFACNYKSKEKHEIMIQEVNEVGKLINYMLLHPNKYGCKEEDD